MPLPRIKLLLLAGLAAACLYGCSSPVPQTDKPVILEDLDLEEGREVEILYTEDGRLRASIQAGRLKRHFTENPYVVLRDTVEVRIFKRGSRLVDSQLNAEYVMVFESKEKLEAREKVIVNSSSGERLETEELTWLQDEQKLFSNSFVKFSTADEIIFGNGFEAREDLSDYTIKDVTGRISLSDEDDATEDF